MKLRKEALLVYVISLLLILIILLPVISAIEITFSKDIYQPQETLQAKITGNFVSLTLDNVFIYKQGKVHPEPIIKDLTKQNNIYYFYAILPKEPGNYSFVIENTEYLERGELKPDRITKDFVLEFKNISDLSFTPGFVIPDKDFKIKVKSLYGNTNLKATFEATGESKELSLIEQKEETVKFKLPKLPPQQSKIILNNYEIPVFLIKKINLTENKLEFIPYKLDGTIVSENRYYFTVLIKNLGNQKIENITLTSDLNVTFSPNLIKTLELNQTVIINLTISVGKVDKKLEGKIIAQTLKDSFYLPIFFNITSNTSEVKLTDISATKSLSCNQLGSLCKENEICDGETVSSLEGACCIGSCKIEKKSNLSTIIGIILLIILIIIVFYIVIKIRQKRKIKSSKEILKESSERFRRRMGGEESEEVYGKLERV